MRLNHAMSTDEALNSRKEGGQEAQTAVVPEAPKPVEVTAVISKVEDLQHDRIDAASEAAERKRTLEAQNKPVDVTNEADVAKTFYANVRELANEVEVKYKIPWQVTLAQAALESNFGRSGLTKKAFNSFGFKAGSSYTGEKLTMQTREVEKGKEVMVNADFRAYSSLRDSFMDYGRLIAESDRYKPAFEFRDDPKKFLETVVLCGYATDPEYTEKATRVLKKMDVNWNTVASSPEAPEQKKEGERSWWGSLLGGFASLKDSVVSLFGKMKDSLYDFLGWEKKKGEAAPDDEFGEGLTDEETGEPSVMDQKVSDNMQDILKHESPGKRAAAMARLAVQTGQCNDAKNCWDWIAKVSDLADSKWGKIAFQDRGNRNFGVLNFDDFEEGTWLYIHNANRWDEYGDHSVIFLGWKDKAGKIAEVASFPGPGKKARTHTVDFNKSPVTLVNKLQKK